MADPPDLLIPVHADTLLELPNTAACLVKKGVLKIVAIGSSSTAGEGGIAPYPSRLQEALRGRYGSNLINVVNLGVGGQEAPDEFARMQDVLDEKPALTIWQVGVNAVWKKQDLDKVADAIRKGLALLATLHSTDVVLMDLQYAPALLTENRIDATRRMQSLIAECATEAKVGVFRRFDLMRKMIEVEGRSFDALIDPGDDKRLHESDYVAQRIGAELCERIVDAATRLLPGAAPSS